jgi:hypothetical protein
MKTTARRYCNLLAILCLSVGSVAQAVVPMRTPEDEEPSLSARAHLAQCRDHARQILMQRAQQNGRRIGNNEIFLVCDGNTGAIRRQIDLWRDL